MRKSDEDGDRLVTTRERFYEKIQSSLNASNWTVAITNLQLLESQFPFGKYAEQAQLELMFAQHRSGDNESAIEAADRFVRLHPQHPNVDYAFYVKGLSEIAPASELLSIAYVPTDNTLRDIGTARDAFATLPSCSLDSRRAPMPLMHANALSTCVTS